MSSHAILNPERQGLVLIKHGEDIDELKKEIGKTVKFAEHAKTIVEQHKLETAKDFGLLKKDVDGIQCSIKKIEDQISGIVDEKTVVKLFEHFEEVRQKETQKAEQLIERKNGQMKIWIGLVTVVITAVLSWAGIMIKGSIDRQNAIFIEQIKGVMDGNR